MSAMYQPPKMNQMTLAQPDAATERPDHEHRQLQGLNGKRDRDDQEAHDDRREHVADEEPDPGKEEPEDVGEGLHRCLRAAVGGDELA
jgi:hypothetical protein